jgi:hypothetical protein
VSARGLDSATRVPRSDADRGEIFVDLLHPPKPDAVVEKALPKAEARKKDELTEEEERELAELMGDDE